MKWLKTIGYVFSTCLQAEYSGFGATRPIVAAGFPGTTGPVVYEIWRKWVV